MLNSATFYQTATPTGGIQRTNRDFGNRNNVCA
jgi:hypothetical protein